MTGRAELPSAGTLPSFSLGPISDSPTGSGVRVIVVRRTQVPLVQLRLKVPLGAVRASDAAAVRLLPKMLLAGSGSRDGSEMAAAIQRIGATIDASADADHLSVSASGPASSLDALLDLLFDIVANPSFHPVELVGERDRVVQEVLQEAADPTATASRALAAELFGKHPYADALPRVGSVRRIGRGTLGAFHRAHLRPSGATLVIVGDVETAAAVDSARRALEVWPRGEGADPAAMEAPRVPVGHDRIVLIDRPGAVQSNLRIGTRCGGRSDPGFPAMLAATTVFGGTFTSRLVANLRERHGYTYSPRAGIGERRLAAALTIRAEVATEVTAKALAEVRYELARMATDEVTDDELDAARRYAMGITTMATATQSGLADSLAILVARGLEPSYLEQLLRDLAALDPAAVAEASRRALAPVGMTTVVVGDAKAIAGSLAALDHVEVAPAPDRVA